MTYAVICSTILLSLKHSKPIETIKNPSQKHQKTHLFYREKSHFQLEKNISPVGKIKFDASQKLLFS